MAAHSREWKENQARVLYCIGQTCSYYCSKIQAVAGIIVTAKYLFGRDWKFAYESENEFDLNTAPEMIRIRQSGRCIGKIKKNHTCNLWFQLSIANL